MINTAISSSIAYINNEAARASFRSDRSGSSRTRSRELQKVLNATSRDGRSNSSLEQMMALAMENSAALCEDADLEAEQAQAGLPDSSQERLRFEGATTLPSDEGQKQQSGHDDLARDDQVLLARKESTSSGLARRAKDGQRRSLVLDLVHVSSSPARKTCWDLLVELLFEDPQCPNQDLASQIEEEFDGLIVYKNRDLRARPLHFAIWIVSNHEKFGTREDAFEDYLEGHEMRLLLMKRADPMSTARYKRKDDLVELSAMHIAAGLGCVCAMELLLEYSPPNMEAELLNRYCLKGGKDYYAPLHDAAFCGQKAAAVWLLDKKALPTAKNDEGYTPLHWLACRGLDSAEDVEDIVKSLLKHKASVRAATADVNQSDHTNQIPLELAVKPGSLFPKHLLYLLAPSYEDLAEAPFKPDLSRNFQSNASFFEDLALMSSHSYRAAHDFAQKICAHGDIACNKAVSDAQRPNAVDCIASLFHMAPEAAACMLGILVETPLMESPGHHGLSSRAVLSGRQMRCDYQPDCKESSLGQHELHVEWPLWKYDSNTNVAPPWHSKLIEVPPEKQSRSLRVYDVETKALLLPNILDIDIFMAWSSARGVHRQIFQSLPIRGAIQCLWDSLVGQVFHLTLFFHVLDGFALLAWGLTPAGMPLFSRLSAVGSETTLPKSGRSEPALWNMVLASVIREGVNTAWWFAALCRKWQRHRKNSRSWNVADRDSQDKVLLSGLHTLWHPLKIIDFSHGTHLLDLSLCVVKVIFLSLLHTDSESDTDTMEDWQQAVLALCFFMQALLLVYSLRVSSYGGKKILVLLKTLSSGAVREVFMVALLILACFICTAMMLDRSGSVGWVFLSLFRGLLLGDGAGLDNLGFDIENGQDLNEAEANSMIHLLNTMSILGTIAFILILNMVIAIYSTEYSRLESQSASLFSLERARYSCSCLLGLMKLRRSRPTAVWAMRLLPVACLAGAFVIFWFAPMQQGPWAAVLLATAQVTLQALMMRSDWFSVREDGSEGPDRNHYLWICYKCDKEKEDDPFSLDSIKEKAGFAVEGELEVMLLSELKDKISALPSKSELINMVMMLNRKSPMASPKTPRSPTSQPSPQKRFAKSFSSDSAPAFHATARPAALIPSPSTLATQFHKLGDGDNISL